MAERSDARASLDDLFERARIVDVARRLGLQLDTRATQPRRAICPFHDDTTPSLHLYEAAPGNRAHYHCFACGAHGDLLDLIKNKRKARFAEAVAWLADVTGTQFRRRELRSHARTAREKVNKAIENGGTALFGQFCEDRRFPPEFLRSQGVGGVSLNALLREAEKDRELAEAAIEAGLARWSDAGLAGGKLVGFYAKERALIRIDDMNGQTAGYAARALDASTPKYLFNAGFKRSETLFGAHRVLRDLQAGTTGAAFTLTIVEGVFDALRLVALSRPAVAVLGSSIWPRQAEIVADILRRASADASDVAVDVFFDADAAGSRGALAVLQRLVALQGELTFSIRVIRPRLAIVPESGGDKVDPDAFLRDVKTPEDARARLDGAAIPALRFLANAMMRRDPWEALPSARAGERAMAARRIAEAFDAGGLLAFLEQIEPTDPDAAFADTLRVFLGAARKAPPSARTETQAEAAASSDEHSALLRALALGRSTTQRREYPFDDAAWDRLAVAATAFYQVHAARLREGEGPSAPYLAREIPKSGGSFRLKCGPVAEDLLLQMHLLEELLRSHPAHELVPAVRYDPNAQAALRLTGDGAAGREPLSFAYQIDMAIADRVAEPARAGLFRSYFECWRDFVEHLDARMARMPHRTLHILRLDIASFYDDVRRADVSDALGPPLRKACERLAAAGGTLAPLFRSDLSDPTERAEAIRNALLEHAFRFSYADPETGEERRSDATRGLPQGPDISAYLSNVVLFGLDELVREEIDALDLRARESTGRADARGGAYARYVDDMVVVAPDAASAERIRRIIESRLQRLGLRLSGKNVSIPPMTRAEARAFITANRAGLGFSGPIEDTLPAAFFDPLMDAGDVEGRKTSLALLFDPALDGLGALAPDGPERSAAMAQLRAALSAHDLRHNDRIAAYRRLWLYAAAGEDSETIDDERFASRFVDLLAAVEGRGGDLSLTGSEARARATAIFDALERAARLGETLADADTPDRRTQAELRARIVSRAAGLAEAVVRELYGRAGRPRAEADAFLNRFDVLAQTLVILNAGGAAGGAAGAATLEPEPSAARQAALGSLWTSHLASSNSATLRGDASMLVDRRDGTRVAFGALHRDVAVIQAWAKDTGESGSYPTASLEGPGLGAVMSAAARIRAVWRGEPGLTEPDGIARAAAVSLVNIAAASLHRLLENRPIVLNLLRNEEAQGGDTLKRRYVALPQPPGLRAKAALLLDAERTGEGETADRWITLVEFDEAEEQDEQARAVVGVAWPDEPTRRSGNLRIYEASLAGFERVLDDGPTDRRPENVARTYRDFFRVLPAPPEGYALAPTVFSLFRRPQDGACKVIAWTAREDALNGHAFARRGFESLEVVEVPERDAPIWRFGWAICDLFDHARTLREPADDANHAREAEAPIGQEDLIAEAIVRRTTRRLVGPDTLGAGGRGDEAGAPPTRVERALRVLEAYAQADDDDARASIAAAAFAHGAMMSELIAKPGDPARPGGLAALAVRAARRGARGLPRASALWRGGEPIDGTLRRGVAAWLAMADRLDGKAAALPEEVARELNMLAATCRLAALSLGLERLALDVAQVIGPELAGGLEAAMPDAIALEALTGARPQLTEHGEPKPVVARADASGRTGDADAKGGSRRMGGAGRDEAASSELEDLRQATEARFFGKTAGAGQITPLGWAALAGSLLLLIPRAQTETDLLRPASPPMARDNEASTEAKRALDAVIALLSKTRERAQHARVEASDLFASFTAIDTKTVAGWLRALDACAGLRVEAHDGERRPFGFEDATGDAPRVEVTLADRSSHALPARAVGLFAIASERTAAARMAGSRKIFPFSAVWSGDALVGVDVVSEKLATTAFGDQAGTSARRINIEAQANLARPAPPPDEDARTDEETLPQEAADEAPRVAEDGADEESADIQAPESRGGPDEAQSPPPGRRSDQPFRTFRDILEDQRRAWDERRHLLGAAPESMRMALLQWDVRDSYEPPDHKKGDHEDLIVPTRDGKGWTRHKPNGEAPDPGSAPVRVISTEEFRRRKIIKAALEACARFEVEGLVLPEYSVRRETVNWIARELAGRKHPGYVWCGTFRVPPGQVVGIDVAPSVEQLLAKWSGTRNAGETAAGTAGVTSQFEDYSAVHACVYRADRLPDDKLAGKLVRIAARAKNHPSVAAAETIRPPDTLWQPLFANRTTDHRRLAAFTIELICSELFVHASSGNIPGAVRAVENLRHALGLPRVKNLATRIVDEILQFSLHTSIVQWDPSWRLKIEGYSERDKFSRDGALPRTIVIVPAMTSRTVDYHVFGQNHHLASRLITVFANAVCHPLAKGESCFVGHDGWGDMSTKESPYGAVGPGIFNFEKKDFGPLGERESALVIADIDPIHSTDSKPRPHFQPRPLRLVAHLPLIYETVAAPRKPRKKPGGGDPAVGDPALSRRVSRREFAQGRLMTFEEAIGNVWSAAHAAMGPRGLSDPKAMRRALRILERFADDPAWLRRRADAALENPPAHPRRATPPPALVDWLYVDDSWPIDAGSKWLRGDGELTDGAPALELFEKPKG